MTSRNVFSNSQDCLVASLLLTVLQFLVRLRADRSDNLLIVAKETIENLLRLNSHEVHRVLELAQLETASEVRKNLNIHAQQMVRNIQSSTVCIYGI